MIFILTPSHFYLPTCSLMTGQQQFDCVQKSAVVVAAGDKLVVAQPNHVLTCIRVGRWSAQASSASFALSLSRFLP